MIRLTQTTGWAVCLVITNMLVSLPVMAEPGDIILGRDVPPQRFDVNRHTGRPTVINPSPIQETNAIHGLVSSGLQDIAELSDSQSSGITSNFGISLNNMPATQLNGQVLNQMSSTNARGAMGGAIGSLHGMTSGIGKSVGSRVGGATHSATSQMRDVLTGTNFGVKP